VIEILDDYLNRSYKMINKKTKEGRNITCSIEKLILNVNSLKSKEKLL
jgi:hypothetical protein